MSLLYSLSNVSSKFYYNIFMIKDVIKRLRLEKNISQNKMGQEIGYARYIISDWEQGRSEPSAEQMKILCIYFNISADELLEIDTPGERAKVQINNSFNGNNINVKIK